MRFVILHGNEKVGAISVFNVKLASGMVHPSYPTTYNLYGEHGKMGMLILDKGYSLKEEREMEPKYAAVAG